ncbi:uncharacterized protein SPPG_08634 [Spizellomyces punctatus DAOM BR117]|uniref:Lipocalin/cytosolic fatty-acid binding domain-containing protein n=1 Tax=Spizellomyces punctatus (strain DAOM BR117) TaxID=645134 RepID=A0A0L0H5P7_SPIPD|nr:uncharacterized protein SPPG_08634 [Spizellomyces punctatus DAOM BR117]KNC96038.1 hypothetical protein SPPG_08634 [Spizellomyces punctatus DAOM BR117]|eukprot:XP_016604078.1 hypothetical protein SPPG_08634 [Spizellomyces punctatus DAOM BR117]
MAVSINDYAGFWTLDSSRTDDYQDVLSAQGVSWVVRKVIANMTITYDITVSKDENGNDVITAVNPKGAKQVFVLDGVSRPDEDSTYGSVAHSATKDANGQVNLTTVSEKNKWKNSGVWTLEENGTVMVRTLSFESPKLTKTFKMTFKKKQ